MMKKTLVVSKVNLIVTLTLLSLAICSAVHADTIKLKGIEEGIEAKITELTQDYIGVVISKTAIKSVTIQPGDLRAYPDLVSLHTNGIELECKIISVNPGSIGIRIPKSEVISMQMVFAPEVAREEKQGRASALGGQRTPTFSPPAEAVEAYVPPALSPPRESWAEMRAAEPQVSRREAKEKIKREVMRELESEEAWPDPQVFKEEIKRELKEELEAKQEVEEKVFQETQLGRVEGRMLRKGQPLLDCEVKIVMLVKAKISLSGSFYQPDMPTEYDGITDEEGSYHLINVAPGGYKFYWKPPTESGWIRRLEMKPDIIVEGGKTTYPKDIETFKRVLN
jgi:hypothetical protein